MAKDDQYVDEVEPKQTDGMGTSLVVVTTLVMIAALVVVWLAMAEYGAGPFKG